MAVTVTGSKYSGTVTSISGQTFTASGSTFLSADFNANRIIALFSSAGAFKGLACIRYWSSSTVLIIETDFFDPVDLSSQSFAAGDTFLVSKNFADIATTGIAVTGDQVTITDNIIFGSATDEKTYCFHDQNKRIRVNNTPAANVANIAMRGGVFCLGKYIDLANKTVAGGCTWSTNQYGGPSAWTQKTLWCGTSQHAHIYMFSGGGDVDTKPIYIAGGYLITGSDSKAQVYDGMDMAIEPVSKDAGGLWTRNPSSHVLRNMKLVAGSRGTGSSILARWGDGLISGGKYQLYGDLGLSVFGSDYVGTSQVSAPVDERLIVAEVGYTSFSGFWRSGSIRVQTLNFTNIVTPNRDFIYSGGTPSNANNSANGSFYFNDSFTGLVSGTKVVVKNSALANVHSSTAGGTGIVSITLLEATQQGKTPTVVESAWTYGVYLYGKQISASTIATSNVTVIGGTAKDVAFSTAFTQLDDTLTTEATKATVDAYATIDDAYELYDRAAAYLEDNYDAESVTIVGRSGVQADIGAFNLVIDSAAGSAYANGGGTITIKSTTFVGGIIATTGITTVQSATALNGGTFDGDIVYSSTATTLTNVTINDAIDFTIAGTYTISGGSLNEITNSSGGAVTLLLTNDATVTTNTGPSITLEQNVNVIAASIADDSRVQLWNTTKAAELDNSIVSGGSGYSYTVNLLGAAVDDGDTLRLRVTYQSGVTAKLPEESSGVISSSGLTFLTTQEADTIYDTIGLDGSTITKFTADYVSDEVDIVSAVDFLGTELYSRFVYFTTTADGIRNFFKGFMAVDAANYKNDVTVLDLFLNNNTATNLKQTDNVRLYKSNEVYPVRNPTTGGGGVDVVWRSQVYIAETGISGLTAAESAKLNAIPTAAENALELLDKQNTV